MSLPAIRTRRPATSRAAREAQRKLNHSVIEKARRTKINAALAALRDLVPCQSDLSHAGRKADKEKEFKLEILERTVIFVESLVQQVAALEATVSTQCEDCIKNSLTNCKRDAICSSISPSPQRDKPIPDPLPPISSWLHEIPSSNFQSPLPDSTLGVPRMTIPSPSTLGLTHEVTPEHQDVYPYPSPLSSPRNVEDDESAATLLLQIKGS